MRKTGVVCQVFEHTSRPNENCCLCERQSFLGTAGTLCLLFTRHYSITRLLTSQTYRRHLRQLPTFQLDTCNVVHQSSATLPYHDSRTSRRIGDSVFCRYAMQVRGTDFQQNLNTCSALQLLGVNLRHFYPRDAMLARVFATATCPSVCLSVRLSHAGIVPSRAKAGS